MPQPETVYISASSKMTVTSRCEKRQGKKGETWWCAIDGLDDGVFQDTGIPASKAITGPEANLRSTSLMPELEKWLDQRLPDRR